MDEYKYALNQITTDSYGRRIEQLAKWVAINTKTGHYGDLGRLMHLLQDHFSGLGGKSELLDLEEVFLIGHRGAEIKQSVGPALRIVKRPDAALRVLLCGHVDTVLEPQEHDVPTGKRDSDRLWGPGALDGKGGVAVILAALEGLEKFSEAHRLGWEVIVVPDEEIGSPGSEKLLKQSAVQCGMGLVFEPALSDGALVGARPGSGNYVVRVHGQAAHAGREPEKGRNAIMALARFFVALQELTMTGHQILVNIGAVEGGGPVNVVPDFAMGRFNIRVESTKDLDAAQKKLDDIVRKSNGADGIIVELQGGFKRPPKLLDRPSLYLLRSLADCGRDLGLDIRWRSTGGVCDGNTLAAAGLPNVDSLGPVGAGMHTGREYVLIESIAERARLTGLFLMKLAAKQIPWPQPGG